MEVGQVNLIRHDIENHYNEFSDRTLERYFQRKLIEICKFIWRFEIKNIFLQHRSILVHIMYRFAFRLQIQYGTYKRS